MQSGSGDAGRQAEPESGGVGKRDGGWRMERESGRGKCLPFCTALKGDIVPAVPLRMPASKLPLGRRLH